ncbi:YkyA family protein [Alkalibacterium sp.]|nr:MAG: hypothetical protein EA249_08965 [Alkalibacterium sp.]
MTHKKLIFASVSTLAVFLTACDDGENLESMQEATEEIDRLKTETVDELNELTGMEAELQTHFSDTLETDDDLSTLSDGSSPVFENIEARESALSSIEEKEAEMEEHQSTLEEYEGEQLDQSEVDQVIADVDAFTDHLAEYRSHYEATLSSQSEYFDSISGEDATYDDFVDGIQSINDEQAELREHLLELDEFIAEFSSNLEQLQSSIETELSDEE